jgi:hypothetical protein
MVEANARQANAGIQVRVSTFRRNCIVISSQMCAETDFVYFTIPLPLSDNRLLDRLFIAKKTPTACVLSAVDW